MIYNKRVTLITHDKVDGFLGEETIEKKTIVPCHEGKLTLEQNQGIFGKLNLSAFKLHLQGYYDDVEDVIYEGRKRTVSGVIHHRNSTVVIVN